MEGESFSLEMKDALSGPAQAMKANLAALKGGMASLGSEILALQKKQQGYKEAGLDGVAKSAGLEISKQRLQMKTLAEQVKATSAAQKDLSEKQKEAAATAKAQDAMLDELTGGLWEVAKAIGAVVLGFAGLVAGGMGMAIQAGTAKTHMMNVFGIFKGTAAEGQKTYDMVAKMSRTLPIPQEKAFESAQSLLSMGLKGTNRLHNTVQALADMQGAMGDEAAGKMKGIVSGAQATTMGGRFRGVFAPSPAELTEIGVSYDAMAGIIGKKLGKSNAEAKQMLMYGRIDATTGIDALNEAISKGAIGKAAEDALLDPMVLMGRFKTNVLGLFSDVDYKPFMQAVRNIVNLFDSGEESGKAMKTTITGAFNSIMKTGAAALEELEFGFLTLESLFLDTEIALFPLTDALEDLLDDDAGLKVIEAAAIAAAIGLGLVALAAGLVALPFVLAGVALTGVVLGFIGLGEAASDAYDWLTITFSKEHMEDVARNVLDGLVGGLRKGVGLVKDTMKDLGDGAITSLNAALGNKSPSTKGRLAGRNLALGVKMGADAEGLDVGGGALTLRAPPPSGAGGGSGGTSGTTIQVTVAPGAVVVHGGAADAGAMMALLEPAVADLFERISEELGRGNA